MRVNEVKTTQLLVLKLGLDVYSCPNLFKKHNFHTFIDFFLSSFLSTFMDFSNSLVNHLITFFQHPYQTEKYSILSRSPGQFPYIPQFFVICLFNYCCTIQLVLVSYCSISIELKATTKRKAFLQFDLESSVWAFFFLLKPFCCRKNWWWDVIRPSDFHWNETYRPRF